MNDLNNKLKQYKAKSDDTTIFKHNKDLLVALEQVLNIHKISEELKSSLRKCINYHDIGKVTDDFQNNIECKHRKIRHEILSASVKNLNESEKLSILLHHKVLDKLAQFINNIYYEDTLNEVKNKLNIEVEDITSYLKKICRGGRENHKKLHDKDLIIQLGLLKMCDHIASAGIKNIDIGLDTKEVFNFEKYRSIQEKVLNLKEIQDIIIQAPTGLGKTETALLWTDLVQNEVKGKRIFYVLPYTASINALYKRFKKQNISVGVLHSKVESLLNREDDIDNIEEELQLFKKNIKQVTICTIFQLLKAMFSCKHFEMILTQLKDSIIVIDEIHCFDLRTFAFMMESLKYLRENFGINICIMSASIPTCMLEFMKETLNIDTLIGADKEDFLIRHHINRVDKELIDDLDIIKEDIEDNKQVLICVNNVATSQQVFSSLREEYSDKNIKLIHGRFNARDRSEIEKDLKNCDVLIGTQAIEVSLDIDYDVLYTEIAPLDALIQRFGRVNRKGQKGIAEIYIYNKSEGYGCIYNDDIINRTNIELTNIIKNDDGVVLEDKVNLYLDKIYPEFDIYKYNEYKGQIQFIIDSIRVGYYNQNASEEMLSDNNTVQVLPNSLLSKFAELREEKRYVEANELFVNAKKYIAKYDNNFKIYTTDYVYDFKGLIIGEMDINNQML
ncbi:CRISPR-associated helicase Cas3' [Clostridium botulinum]|uniref:CRISPR-associated helicase Cas3' n=1 Tax=Clostridium botulinum TaxID=1491 RepID=UPI001E318DB8|nr:CRISPR-associated helicase Cas3' [Clostridium botulinum]MCD3276689.1 CRISPR-associated helicase Cas3' [Clostridium botulinum C/D]MCD3288286.1 CRISPR-associated helicase Cas3' [Clostridium botulinum C/D]MCD3290797.1 CRISPR-associated helicase Cas3' [Clostridium botulinum C/D]MCD3303781.1 CRISPR-associated helicase Cas3' [Clostridium botulinum C/D]